MPVLEGKVAVVTGGTRGFGLAVAKAFALEGASVVVGSRSKELVNHAIAELKEINHQAGGRTCDISEPPDVHALYDYAIGNFGKIDIWVNNAALSAPYGPTIEIPRERVLQVFETNIIGTYECTLVAMRYFLARGEGKLINILGAGDRSGRPRQNPYNSTKAWLIRFTKTLAQEYQHSGVGVFALNPGMMDTELLTKIDVIEGYENSLKSMDKVIGMFSKPPEAPARKAVWLASSETDGRTGLIVRETSTFGMLSGVARHFTRTLLNRPVREFDIQLNSVPSSFPSNKDMESLQ